MTDYISREDAIAAVKHAWAKGLEPTQYIEIIPAVDVVEIPKGGIGELSDGYHTFNSLYYQRMVLFSALVNAFQSRAWKSWKHEDGELCFGGGWFIVGIDTPQGSYTYHYEDTYWNWFECEELHVAKHWEGHTDKDVVRLCFLPDVAEKKQGKWESREGKKFPNWFSCSSCQAIFDYQWRFCPNCGAKMEVDGDV